MELVVGMKVVPHQKTRGLPLSKCNPWKKAQEDNQKFLYIVDIDYNIQGQFIDLSNKPTCLGPNKGPRARFNLKDVTVYQEENKMGRKEELLNRLEEAEAHQKKSQEALEKIRKELENFEEGVPCVLPVFYHDSKISILFGNNGNGYRQRLSYRKGYYKVSVHDNGWYADYSHYFNWVPCTWDNIEIGDVCYCTYDKDIKNNQSISKMLIKLSENRVVFTDTTNVKMGDVVLNNSIHLFRLEEKDD